MVNKAAELNLKSQKLLKHIAVVGDAMIDKYYTGHLALSQDGCSKFVQEDVRVVAGGAANAVRQLSKWHCVVSQYTQSMAEQSVKTRYIVDGQYVFRHDEDKTGAVFRKRTEQLAIKPLDAILISDYAKGLVTFELVKELVAIARAKHIPIIADVKREPEFYAGCLIKCNEAYASNHSPIPLDIITRGALPPFVKGTEVTLPRVFDVPCVNHVGAGDCFAAHLAFALAHRFSLMDAATIAHSAGRVYVQKAFNKPPYPGDIIADMEPRDRG